MEYLIGILIGACLPLAYYVLRGVKSEWENQTIQKKILNKEDSEKIFRLYINLVEEDGTETTQYQKKLMGGLLITAQEEGVVVHMIGRYDALEYVSYFLDDNYEGLKRQINEHLKSVTMERGEDETSKM